MLRETAVRVCQSLRVSSFAYYWSVLVGLLCELQGSFTGLFWDACLRPASSVRRLSRQVFVTLERTSKRAPLTTAAYWWMTQALPEFASSGRGGEREKRRAGGGGGMGGFSISGYVSVSVSVFASFTCE